MFTNRSSGEIILPAMATDGDTLPLLDSQQRGGAAPQAALLLALEYRRPAAGSLLISLAEVDEVIIGRGSERSVERRGAAVTLLVPDLWMSRSHVRLRRSDGRWSVADLGSKNGFAVDGETGPGARELEATSEIEVGQTLFRFLAPAPTELAPTPDAALPGFATLCPPLGRQLAEVARVAASTIPVLLLGESGTGKEVLARAIHAASGRPGAFIATNCASIPQNLVEAELFGHRRGAFSGATEERPGLFRSADGGTVLLDEIGELPAASQAALLRVLQERAVVPIGDTRPVPVDFRLIAATNRALPALTAADRFRGDLYARLSGLVVRLPPLRERIEDLGALIAAIVRRAAPRPEQVSFTRTAARALFHHAWPFNVRELESCLTTAIALGDGGVIDRGHLKGLDEAMAASPTAEALADDGAGLAAEDQQRRDALLELLRLHRGNVTAVARDMARAPMQIYRWMQRYGIRPEAFRG
jgi:sigma-54 dependent transcriptional regulator, acetoin dehydrogenase operon transcriptional activator AcoR